MVKTDYVGDFGIGKLIQQKAGTTGLDRYYIMALKDEALPNGRDYSGEELGLNKNFRTAYWYYNARGKTTDYETFTSEDFGEGKNNTKKMVARWRANGTAEGSDANYGEGRAEDIWGQIGAPTNLEEIVWFVPSKEELCAFGGELGVTGANYLNEFKLSPAYWSSSLYDDYGATDVSFFWGYMRGWNVYYNDSVRLSATF